MKKTLKIEGIISNDPIDGEKTFSFADLLMFYGSVEKHDEIEIFIDSPGGDVFAGNLIYDYIKADSEKRKITITALNECCSIATKIFCAVKKENRFVSESTIFMIHLPMVSFDENSMLNRLDFKEMESVLKNIEKDLVGTYTESTTLDKKVLSSLIEMETVLTPEQCVSLGFASKIIKSPLPIKKMVNLADKLLIINLVNMNKKSILARSLRAFNFKNIFSGRKYRDLSLSAKDSNGTDVVLESPYEDLIIGDALIINEAPADPGVYEVTSEGAGLPVGTKISVDENGYVVEIILPSEDPEMVNQKTLAFLNLDEAGAVELIQELQSETEAKDELIEQLVMTVEELQSTTESQAEKVDELEMTITNMKNNRPKPGAHVVNFGNRPKPGVKGFTPESLLSDEMRKARAKKK